MFRRKKKPLYDVDKNLDLHGSTEREAKEMVNVFIDESTKTRLRIVRVITGRGKHSFGKRPIIRKAVRKLLKSMRRHKKIAKFEKDRGLGAFIVFLNDQEEDQKEG